jgi:hypothetical protein
VINFRLLAAAGLALAGAAGAAIPASTHRGCLNHEGSHNHGNQCDKQSFQLVYSPKKFQWNFPPFGRKPELSGTQYLGGGTGGRSVRVSKVTLMFCQPGEQRGAKI